MEQLLAILMSAQKTTKTLHWREKSFARHIALDELYNDLIEMTDTLAEIWMGKYGNDVTIPQVDAGFPTDDAKHFVDSLFGVLEMWADKLPNDEYIQNQYQELLADVARAKYKIDNLT